MNIYYFFCYIIIFLFKILVISFISPVRPAQSRPASITTTPVQVTPNVQSTTSHKADISVSDTSEKSLIDDHPDYYDPEKPPRYPRYEVEIPHKEFKDLNPTVQSEIINQLNDLKKRKNNGIFVPNVNEYTNPFIFFYILNWFIISFGLTLIFSTRFYVTLGGPFNSVYKGKYFDLQICFDDDFPEKAPIIRFTRQAQTGELPVHPV